MDVLNAFLSKENALSHHAVEQALSSNMDRVTLYRTLNSFIEKGILHKVTDNSGISHFALCHSCDHEHHFDEHVHFKCTSCESMVCIDTAILEAPALPKGYATQSMKVVLEGTCPKCV
ncbi:MAG: transcriptional repressor [Saprospiraceae bacterium]|nr:transcriptional repressor [Saprospiraceae bacterium]